MNRVCLKAIVLFVSGVFLSRSFVFALEMQKPEHVLAAFLKENTLALNLPPFLPTLPFSQTLTFHLLTSTSSFFLPTPLLAAPFAPGDTLDPGCSPGDVDCYVEIPPAGSDGQVQYNNGGSFGGASTLFFDDGTNYLGVNDNTPSYQLDVNGIIQAQSGFRTNSETITDFTGVGLQNSSGTLSLDINGLTDLGGAGTSGDWLALYDTSAGAIRKVDWDDLPAGGGSPGGNDGDLQINNSGSFGTVGGLNLNKTGNARGTGALDIQSNRNAVTQVASGNYSIAFGVRNTVSGHYSVAMGWTNTVNEDNASAFGRSNTASNYHASALGNGNTASAVYSTAVGFSNDATTDFGATAAGYNNTASNRRATAVGSNNTSSGYNSAAMGYNNTASNKESIAFGVSNTASADYALVFGRNITNSTSTSLAIGPSNTAKLTISSAGAVGFANGAFTFPTSDGTSGQVLQTNGSGAVSWATVSGGSVSFGSDNQIPYTNSSTDDFDYSANFTFDGTGMILQSSGGATIIDGDSAQSSNARGTNALDIQSDQSSATQVASDYSSLAFGQLNTATSSGSATSGGGTMAIGYSNTATGGVGFGPFTVSPAVSIGVSNTATAASTVPAIALGISNTSSSGIAVGRSNTASGSGNVAFGLSNTASGSSTVAIGASNNSSGSIAIGKGNTNSGSSVAFGVTNSNTAGYAFGVSNTNSYANSFAFGNANSASGYSFGDGNTGSGYGTFIFGEDNDGDGAGSYLIGEVNTTNGSNGNGASMAIGYSNDINDSGAHDEYLFGASNTVTDSDESAAFGINNTISSGSDYGLVFGRGNTASAAYTYTFGNAITNDVSNSVMIGPSDTSHITILNDGNIGTITCENPDHDLIIGGTGSGCDTGTYSEIDAGETSFTASSSRTLKENFENVVVDDILDKILKVPVYTYDFIDGPEDKLGLVAEDFHTIFKRGSDRQINGQEMSMALWLGVQELTKEVSQLKLNQLGVKSRTSTLSSAISGITKLGRLVLDSLEIGSPAKPTGITLYDEITGEPYCISVRDGETVTRDGKCEIGDLSEGEENTPSSGGSSGGSEEEAQENPDEEVGGTEEVQEAEEGSEDTGEEEVPELSEETDTGEEPQEEDQEIQEPTERDDSATQDQEDAEEEGESQEQQELTPTE